MDHSQQPANPVTRAGSAGPPSVRDLQCPLPMDPVGVDRLTPEMCAGLDAAGCPVAPAIHYRLRFETLLSELSTRFVNVPANRVDSQIESGLQLLVELLNLDRAGLGEVSADGKQFVVTHSYQLPGVPPSSQLALHSQFPTYARMICRGEVIRIPDDFPSVGSREREYCLRTGLKSNLTIPLTINGAVVGGIGFSSFRSAARLPDELIPRLRLIGDIFTNALARKRADEALRAKEQALRRSQAGLRKVASKLLHAQEEERRRVAREMHDDWTQRLAVLGIETAKLEKHLEANDAALSIVSAIRDQLVSLSLDVHDLSRQLHPSILDDLGLSEALRSECTSFSRRENIAVDYRPDRVPEALSTEVALCLYRVAQEALRNVAKHASVKEVSLGLSTNNRELVMLINDQGAGFDMEAMRSEPSVGLSSMEERIRLVQGKLSIRSAPGQGTTVEVRVPMTEGNTL